MTEDDEEQVIGVLARCETCDEKTLHVDGVCQDHKIVRRRRKRPEGVVGALESRRAGIAAERAADEAKRRARRSGGVRNVVMFVVAGGLIWLLGATHVLHGDASGIAFCWKSGWSLSDTLVDTDKLASEPPPKKVLDALAACEY